MKTKIFKASIKAQNIIESWAHTHTHNSCVTHRKVICCPQHLS